MQVKKKYLFLMFPNLKISIGKKAVSKPYKSTTITFHHYMYIIHIFCQFRISIQVNHCAATTLLLILIQSSHIIYFFASLSVKTLFLSKWKLLFGVSIYIKQIKTSTCQILGPRYLACTIV